MNYRPQDVLTLTHNVSHTGTVVDLEEVSKSVLKFQQSREFKCDKHGYINMPVGKVSS